MKKASLQNFETRLFLCSQLNAVSIFMLKSEPKEYLNFPFLPESQRVRVPINQ
jgi:hypothetical protein